MYCVESFTALPASLRGSGVPEEFFCGVIEGFYGKPWSLPQRRHIFERLRCHGLNTYLYAPKDDLKHRQHWHVSYTPQELKILANLIQQAGNNNIRFIYGISPGVSTNIPARKKVKLLIEKLQSVASLGCTSFALLFDDICSELCSDDREEFGDNTAACQSFIANSVLEEFLDKPMCFFFCPTEYCGSRAVPSVLASPYLNVLGERLDPTFDILWTGPNVVSRDIPPASLEELATVIRRRPVIWDNLHANDYDQKVIYLGPYNRHTDIMPLVRGVLSNPNCEFEANFVPLMTLGMWVSTYFSFVSNNKHSDSTINGLNGSATSHSDQLIVAPAARQASSSPPCSQKYDPREAFRYAICQWLPLFYQPKYSVLPLIENRDENVGDEASSTGSGEAGEDMLFIHDAAAPAGKAATSVPQVIVNMDETSNHSDAMDCGGPTKSTMVQDKAAKGQKASGKTEAVKKGLKDVDSNGTFEEIPTMIDKLTESEIEMVADVFYLPFENGPFAEWLQREFIWLRSNAASVRLSNGQQSSANSKWMARAVTFEENVQKFSDIVDKLGCMPNRNLLFDLYPYVADMRCTIGLLNSYIKSIHSPKPTSREDPWTVRGGFAGELQRLLPAEFVKPPTNHDNNHSKEVNMGSSPTDDNLAELTAAVENAVVRDKTSA